MPDSLQVVCPHCHTANRVQSARLRDTPKCGRCKQALFTAKPLELSAASFTRHSEHTTIPLLVDFWAPWCGPCRAMAPHFEAAAKELEPAVCLAKLNTEQFPQLAQQFGIRSIPTLAIFANGREIARQSGAMDARALTRWVRAQIGQVAS